MVELYKTHSDIFFCQRPGIPTEMGINERCTHKYKSRLVAASRSASANVLMCFILEIKCICDYSDPSNTLQMNA